MAPLRSPLGSPARLTARTRIELEDEALEGVLGRNDLVAQDGQVLLVGSRCSDCGATTFPSRKYCPRCGATAERATLPRFGTLWAYTVQAFPPKPPYLGPVDRFVPYGVGYIDLDGEVLVEARLVAETPEELHTGMTMELVLAAVSDSLRTYAFRAQRSTPEIH